LCKIVGLSDFKHLVCLDFDGKYGYQEKKAI